MPRTPADITPPKAHYRAERDNGYSDWLTAFHREYIQNLLDAGATSARITIDEAPSRSTFGRQPNEGDGTENAVVRVEISDNGSGMTEDVLRNVFFQPGTTTKSGDGSIGGFGTARLMLCYAQDSYRIVTNGFYVEGDGSQYLIQTVPEATSELRQAAREEEGTPLGALQERELQALGSMASAQEKGGCLFSIDIPMGRQGNVMVNRQTVEDALRRYVSMSQLPIPLYLNGEEMKGGALRRQARRSLTAEIDGTEQGFATVHVSNGEKAPWKGMMLVRSSGALMFSRKLDIPAQVIVELDPKLSREVLTDRRDSLKYQYRAPLDVFVDELHSDTTSALRAREQRKDTTVRGGRGGFSYTGEEDPEIDFSFTGSIVLDEGILEPEKVPESVRTQFRREIAAARPTFLDSYPDKDEVTAFKAALLEGEGWEALNRAPAGLQVFVTQNLAQAMRSAGIETAGGKVVRDRFGEMHDIRIVSDAFAAQDEKLKNSARRWSPDYWVMLGDERNAPLGRGMQAHKFLAAWTVCVREAFAAARKARPDLFANGRSVDYTTGFRFARGRERFSSRGVDMVREASMVIPGDETQKAAFLINPHNVDGSTAYDLTKENAAEKVRADGRPVMGISELENQAVADVCRLLNRMYDRDFADLVVGAMSMFDRARNREKIMRAEGAVLTAYGKGEALIQKLDDMSPDGQKGPGHEGPGHEGDEEEMRPAERLMALAAPHVAASVGLAEANPHVQADAIHELKGKIVREENGLTAVNCDELQKMESSLVMASRNDWKNDAAPAQERTVTHEAPLTQEGPVAPEAVVPADVGSAEVAIPEVVVPEEDLIELTAEDEEALNLTDITDFGVPPSDSDAAPPVPDVPLDEEIPVEPELDELDLEGIDLEDILGHEVTPEEEARMQEDLRDFATQPQPAPEQPAQESVRKEAPPRREPEPESEPVAPDVNPWLADEFDVSTFFGGPGL